jgi:deoxyadenosine/deoxycytidine kinase
MGSGKTTLARRLAPRLGWALVEEPLEASPFLEAFYADPASYTFENTVFYAIDYAHRVKKAAGKPSVFDHAHAIHRAYVTLDPGTADEARVYAALDGVLDALPPPALIINLLCPPRVLLNRIRVRGRSFEQGVTEDYLDRLSREVQKHAADEEKRTRILHVDAEDFDLETLREQVEAVLSF